MQSRTLDDLFPEGLRGARLQWLRSAVTRLLGIEATMRAVAEAGRRYPSEPGFRGILRVLNIAADIRGELEAMPTAGPLIVVANHPFGAAEGMILHELVRSRREDIRTMAVHQLGIIAGVSGAFILVDASGGPGSGRANVRPMAEAIRWLREGGALALFPAGAISRYMFNERRMTDPPWSNTLGGLVRRSGAAVVPVHFRGFNSRLFNVIAALRPRLSSVLLARELLNKRGRTLHAMVGPPVDNASLIPLGSDAAITAELRRRTYRMSDE